MGYLIGIFDQSRREISTVDSSHVARVAGPAAHLYRQPGLLMACGSGDIATTDRSGRQLFDWPHGNCLTWDGRLDNRGELGSSLRVEQEHSDSDAALACYDAEGVRGLRRLIGDWSLVLWNPAQPFVTLASDFAGVRPLFYCEDKGRLLWSSALQPLIDWIGEDEPDAGYLAELVVRGSTGCLTPHSRIRAVPPGQAVQYSSSGVTIAPFWRLDPQNRIEFNDDAQYEQRFRELFEEAVAVRLRSDGPVYSELSGGLDSSSIVCMADKLIRENRVQTPRLVGLTFQHPHSTDEPFVRSVRRHCGIEFAEIDVLAHPFVTSGSPGGAAPAFWEVRHSEVKRQMEAGGSTVLLSGQIGDLITGNRLDDSAQVADLLRRGAWRKAAASSWAWSRYLKVPVHSVLWRAIRLNLPWGAANCDEVCPLPKDSADSLTAKFRKRAAGLQPDRAAQSATAGRRLHFSAVEETLESRALAVPDGLYPIFYTHPFVHRPLVEYMLAIPAEIVCGIGEPRRLMRRALGSLLPDSILRRRSKATFNTVFTSALRPLAADLLQAPRASQLVLRGYAEPASLEARLRRFLNGLDCNEGQLRHLILVEFWLRSRVSPQLVETAALPSFPSFAR